jgi:hypothetical protein
VRSALKLRNQEPLIEVAALTVTMEDNDGTGLQNRGAGGLRPAGWAGHRKRMRGNGAIRALNS